MAMIGKSDDRALPMIILQSDMSYIINKIIIIYLNGRYKPVQIKTASSYSTRQPSATGQNPL
jgi:hypothetical protein